MRTANTQSRSKTDISKKKYPVCEVHGGYAAANNEQLMMNDPKNYKYLPSNFVGYIKPAGKLTANQQSGLGSLLTHQ